MSQTLAINSVDSRPFAPTFGMAQNLGTNSVWAAETDIEAGVAHTARWTAAMRYLDTETAKPLLKDPLARIFAGEMAIMKWREELGRMHAKQPYGKSHIAIRARALDDIVTTELKNMQPADLVQVVSLGAGMCSRAWRLPNPGSRVIWFEVDRPDSMRLKQKLASGCGQPSLGTCFHIGMDFENPNASLTNSLLQHGFKPHAPTIFIIEGVLCYLTIPTIEKQAVELDNLAKGKACIVHTVINAGFLRELQTPNAAIDAKYPGTKDVTPLIISSWEGGIRTAFEQSGWSTESVVSREEYARQRLGVEMLDYEFPDRRISTELIVVSRRRQQAFQTFQSASLAPSPQLQTPQSPQLQTPQLQTPQMQTRQTLPQYPQSPQMHTRQALFGSPVVTALGMTTSGNVPATSQGTTTTLPSTPTRTLAGTSTTMPTSSTKIPSPLSFLSAPTSYADALSTTMPASPSKALSPLARLPVSSSFTATDSIKLSPRRSAYTPNSPSRDSFGMVPTVMVL